MKTVTLVWCLFATTNNPTQVWHNTDSQPPKAVILMKGTNVWFTSTPWIITTNWSLLTTTTNDRITLPATNRVELFTLRNVAGWSSGQVICK